jgi:alpha-galactosidase
LVSSSITSNNEVHWSFAQRKKWRDVIHTGRTVYADTRAEDAQDLRGVVSQDGKRALLTFTQLATSQSYPPSPMTLPGLQADTAYRLTISNDPAVEHNRFVGQSDLPWRDAKEPCILSGAMLASVGVQVPALLPESLIVFEVEALNS